MAERQALLAPDEPAEGAEPGSIYRKEIAGRRRAHGFRPRETRSVAAAKKGGSRGAFPFRSPAWTINCQRTRGRDAARRARRASFPRPPPIRRGLHVLQRPLRAAFTALRASFPRLRAVRRRGRAPRAPPREARWGSREPFPRLRPSRAALRGPFPGEREARRAPRAVRERGNAAREREYVRRELSVHVHPRSRGEISGERPASSGERPSSSLHRRYSYQIRMNLANMDVDARLGSPLEDTGPEKNLRPGA
jgi:hypothetical protein